MGWLHTHREAGMSNREFFTREWGEDFVSRVKVWGSHLHTMYLAYESPATNERPACTIALVYLTDWQRGERFNFGWKDMDEFMGPNADECPRKVLVALTPLDEIAKYMEETQSLEYARSWRQRCWDNIHKKAKLQLHPGMVLHTERPLRFTNGQEYCRFEVMEPRRNSYMALSPAGQPLVCVKLARRALLAADPKVVI